MTKSIFIALLVISFAACGESYHDPFGNEISKEEHERRVANDAARDALVNLMAECRNHPQPGCPVQEK
ncbi:hypothetical protein V8G57_09105 [Collimonas sp. H4R21]|uniref:Entry exclusion lipoprotein TrbK n=1 Tax=Collimonas rhizosphaerae TaxID=3126357 RepID=A0ABU9PU78_9BURK